MLPQISEILARIPIRDIAIRTNFLKRLDGKITPLAFISSFYWQMSSGKFSQTEWAQKLSLLLKSTISSQSICSKLSYRHLQFAKELLKCCLQFTLQKSYSPSSNWLSGFARIIVVDSTCLSMPKVLKNIFPGSFSKFGPAATAKIQLSMDLKNDQILSLDIKSFRNNDQSYAHEICALANSKDLVIRDLGYFTVSSIKALQEENISFISKLKLNVNIYDSQGVRLDLLDKLNAAFKNNANSVDWQILLSQSQKIPLRLVAFKVDQKTFQTRKEKAKNDRHAAANHSQKYMQCLHYTIYITNVKKKILKPKQIHQAYCLRWRIESIFKCWKSNLNLQRIFKGKKFTNPAKPEMMLYLVLSMIVLYQNKIYSYYRNIIKSNQDISNASIFKIPALIQNIESTRIDFKEEFLVQYFQYYGRTMSRKGKNTYLERLYIFN